MVNVLWRINLKRREHLEERSLVDGVWLKWILKKYRRRMRTGLVWLRIVTSAGFGFYNILNRYKTLTNASSRTVGYTTSSMLVPITVGYTNSSMLVSITRSATTAWPTPDNHYLYDCTENHHINCWYGACTTAVGSFSQLNPSSQNLELLLNFSSECTMLPVTNVSENGNLSQFRVQ
jgi:hypothetical protein